MHSAFRRGIELLSASESGPVQSQGQTVDNHLVSGSQHIEAISGVPKNVKQLQPVIDELKRKVSMIVIWSLSANAIQYSQKGADKKWRMKAKERVEWVRKEASKEEEFLKKLMAGLEVASSEGFGEGSQNPKNDTI